jgi:uncharacterized membrane protein
VKRFPFLDWMRGLAVLVMIQCHTFNSFTRLDLRDGGPYVMTQFVGGMAAPLFLFMAGMTTGFQMESLERRERSPLRRWAITLRRAGYILAIAFTFRFTNWVFAWPLGDWREMLRVDVLNCMGAAMLVAAVSACFAGAARVRFGIIAGLAIAGLAPVVANLDWTGAPKLVQEYIAAAPGRRFPLFPWAAYVAFGAAMGGLVRRASQDRFERLMQWSVLVGFGLVFACQYFSNLPYSIYERSNFWLDSPTLVLMRVGMILLAAAAAYLWTEYGAGARWSWMQALGRNSLMVYWIHVMIVYGSVVRPVKRSLSIPMAALATLLVTLGMIALSAIWDRWKGQKEGKPGAEEQPRLSPTVEPARTGA